MMIDAGYEGDLFKVASTSKAIDGRDLFSGFWVSDTTNDPFLLSSQALNASRRLQVGTNIAVAFARSPFVVAQTAWNLQGLSGGRFLLGLGPQVKPHIEKRFSMTWPEKPAKAMEEYLQLLRHLFATFAQGGVPNFRAETYRCTLGSPVFTPDRHEFGPPPVGISAVGRLMTKVAGRTADMIFLHPFTHLEYLKKVSLVAIAEGAKERPAELAPLKLVGSVFTVPTDHPKAELLERKVRDRVAFYASTPNYQEVLEVLGMGALHSDLHALSRQGRWAEMGAAVPEALLEQCVVRAKRDSLPAAVRQRFEGIYDRALIDATPWVEA